MNAATALGILLANLNQLATFGAAIAKAQAEGRDLTDAEVALGRRGAIDAIDALERAIGHRP